MKFFTEKACNAFTFGIDARNKNWKKGLKKRLPLIEITLWQRAACSIAWIECFRNSIGILFALHIFGYAITVQTRNSKKSEYKSLINRKLPKCFWH